MGIFRFWDRRLRNIPHAAGASALLALIGVAPGLAFANQAPVIEGFDATPTAVAPGGMVELSVTAFDPDCPDSCTDGCGAIIRSDLTVWTASGGSFTAVDNGTSASPYAATAQWQAPAVEDVYTLQVEVADSGTFLCGGRLTATASVLVTVTSSGNQAPDVESVTADPARPFPGETALLSCTAVDPDGDVLTYGWSSDFGTVKPGPGSTAEFVLLEPGVATISCVATDPQGASGMGTAVVSVSDVSASRRISDGLTSPQRLAVDSFGSLIVVDGAAGGIAVLRLEDGRFMYRLGVPDVTAVAVDWADRLLVGTSRGARVIERDGTIIRRLGSETTQTSDVEVDIQRREYVVLMRNSGRVIVYDDVGSVLAEFGSTGDAPNQLRSPSGVAVLPDGRIVVADSGHRVIKVFNRDGSLSLTIGGGGSGAGEFVELDDVAVDSRGVIWASDALQSWVQSFGSDGSVREIVGTFGDEVGQFKTPAGIALAERFDSLVVASLNGSSAEVFQLGPPEPVDWPIAQASVSTAVLEFSPQPVGLQSTPLGVDLLNTGDAPLGVSGVEVRGPFLVSGGCEVVEPAAACGFNVLFRPSAPGSQSGELLFHTSAGQDPLRIVLLGLGYLPAQLTTDPSSLEFSTQAIGTSSGLQTVVVTNTGTVDLDLTGISATGAFVSSTQCGGVLAGGSSCAVWVRFNPVAPGVATGTLTISGDVSNSPRQISLSGIGELLELSPQPSAIGFADTVPGAVSRTAEIEVLNTGTARIDVGSLTLDGADASDFEIVTDQCSGNQVDVAQVCWVQVRFSPTEVGIKQARLVIPTSPGFDFEVELTGGLSSIFSDGFETGDLSAWTTSVPADGIRVSPTGIVFGEVVFGGESALAVVTVTNGIDQPVWVGQLKVVGDHAMEFAIYEDYCSSSWIEMNESCWFTVTMLALDDGSFTAKIELPTPTVGDQSPAPVILKGVVRLP